MHESYKEDLYKECIAGNHLARKVFEARILKYFPKESKENALSCKILQESSKSFATAVQVRYFSHQELVTLTTVDLTIYRLLKRRNMGCFEEFFNWN